MQEEEEVVVIMGPTLLWEMQTPSLFDGRWGVFCVYQKKGELLGSCWSN
jgi:hypothetical protein